MSVTRKSQKTDVIYVTPGAEQGAEGLVFFSPDGKGRVWYDTVNEAKEETGLTKVIYLLEDPED